VFTGLNLFSRGKRRIRANPDTLFLAHVNADGRAPEIKFFAQPVF